MARPRKHWSQLTSAQVMAQARSMAKKKSQVATKGYVKKQITGNQDINDSGTQSQASANVAYDSTIVFKAIDTSVAKEYVKSNLRLRSTLYNAAGPSCTVRMIIFQYLQGNASLPVLSDVINSSGAATDIYKGYNYANRHNYKILYDRMIDLGGSTNGAIAERKSVDVIIPLKRLSRKILVQTDASTATFKGCVYVLLTSDVANASTPPVFAGTMYYLRHQVTEA